MNENVVQAIRNRKKSSIDNYSYWKFVQYSFYVIRDLHRFNNDKILMRHYDISNATVWLLPRSFAATTTTMHEKHVSFKTTAK